MSKYLLMIKKRNWDNLDVSWLINNDIQADPLCGLLIIEGSMSVWYIDDSKLYLDLIIAALVVNRQNLDKFEQGLFDHNVLDDVEIKVEKTTGTTPIDNINSFHRDLTQLTIDKATILIKAIFPTIQKERVPVENVKQKVIIAIEKEQINFNSNFQLNLWDTVFYCI